MQPSFRRIWLYTILGLLLIVLLGCKSGSSYEAFVGRGKDLLEKKDYARALIEFRNAEGSRPRSAEPYYQSALAYLALGDYATAYGNLVRATELDPKHTGPEQVSGGDRHHRNQHPRAASVGGGRKAHRVRARGCAG